ncbi:Ulp1 family isopeptidase [Bradyrhizobium valentinum]|uniref:Ulp1 family isopeptidase n=1 Tax=Bradyrhizobium valentinum TaxID=1518501 RepID=UPI0012E346CF|nr:Ulp1 family isopeptidase [Bradyrhizobium valentinum]
MDLPAQLSHAPVDIQAIVPAEDFPRAKDFTHIVGLGWDHSCQSAPDALIGSLNRKGLLPTTPLRSRAHFYIHGRPYTTKLGQGTREATPNNLGGLGVLLIPGYGLESHEPLGAGIESFPGYMGETSSSTRAATSAMSTKNAKGCGLWSCFKSGVGKALRGSRCEKLSGHLDQSDGQASGSGIPLQPPLVLGPTELLGDEHITADYTLLERELQRDNSDLAARTRFLRPAQAHLLRLTKDEDTRQETLRGIVNDEDGNDTANFLFVPVNDGGVGGGGTHWSLLLVDRREPEGRVAYHYNSIRRSNSTAASQLAGRLGTRLEPARMARQGNNYDCGVFVLDATRTLVGRLAERQRPDDEPLHLDNLVADRQALRDRLRGRPHFATR